MTTILVVVESKDRIIERKTDSRVRITLGSEDADQDVNVAVIDAADVLDED